ncbi:hypothetical protein TRVA0_002S01662 [Trichomonascus vanleenenianus]|uniref:uncharacterized protein n=1 Tax=Trichomonascus vanleenenianus TaxID=2268995 RepID=UPI003ECA4EE0
MIRLPSCFSRLIVAKPARQFVNRPYSSITPARTNVLSGLRSRCETCGSPFHKNGDEHAPGHIHEPPKKETPSVKEEDNAAFDQLFASLDKDKQEFLKNEAFRQGSVKDSNDFGKLRMKWALASQEPIAKSIAEEKRRRKENDHKKMCKRCFMITKHQPEEIRMPEMNAKQIKETIPDSATAVHVIDAMDFPCTVDRTFSSRRNTLWVINRADLLVDEEHKANKRLLPYVQQELYKIARVSPDRVFVTSAKRGWGLGKLYSALKGENYFVGSTNTGKTALAMALWGEFRGSAMIPDLVHRRLSVCPYPWMTQSPIAYELKEDKIVMDMPSYPEANMGTYGVVKNDYLRDITYGHQLTRNPGIYNVKKRIVASSPKQMISFGGLVVVGKDDQHLIGWTIGYDQHVKTAVYNSLEKIEEWASMEEIPRHLKQVSKQFYHHPQAAKNGYDIVRVPIFSGGLTIAVRGIGIMHLNIFGKIPEEGIMLTVHKLKGVQIAFRSNILPYLRNSGRGEPVAEMLAEQEIEAAKEQRKLKK